MALFTLTHFHQFVQHPTRLLQFLGDLRSFKGYHHNASIEDTVYSIYQIRSLRYSLIKIERKSPGYRRARRGSFNMIEKSLKV